jgi:septal ring factor EnvC (AmiA/AmiB activator)
MKRLIPLLLFMTVLCTPSQPAYGAVRNEPASKQDQINQIEEDLSREREQFLKFGEKEKDLLKDLSSLEREIEEKKQNLKDLEESATRVTKELNEGQAKLAELENALSEVEDRLGRRLDAFYKYAKRGYVRLLATSKGLDVLRKRIKYLKAIMKNDLTLMNTMADLQQQYRQQILGVKDKLLELNRLQKTENSSMASLKEDIDKRVILLMKIHKEKEFYQTAVKELGMAAQNLKETILKLDKKRDGKLLPLPDNFEESKGKLPLPLNGKIVRDESGSGQNGSKGIFVEAPSGAKVKAVFPGRVDFSGALKGYGQVIVINHGSRYFTVSAQLARRYKEAGESVKAGDVIGSLPEINSMERSSLYFEIRQGAGNLDPLKWLKVH